MDWTLNDNFAVSFVAAYATPVTPSNKALVATRTSLVPDGTSVHLEDQGYFGASLVLVGGDA